MMARYTASAGFAAAVTGSLLLLMQFLIGTDGRVRPNVRPPHLVDFIQVERPPPEIELPERASKPPEVVDEPPLPPLATVESTIKVTTVQNPSRPPARPSWPRNAGTILDGDALPIVTVAPDYPRRARELGIEGYVVVEFTITATGSVADAHVVESTHSVFDKAAVEAAGRFKYRPRVVNGRPVEIKGAETRIVFVLGGSVR